MISLIEYISIAEEAKELVITERESVSSLTFIVLTIMAFYGPNADLLGNIKLTIWHFQNPILDIDTYIFNVLLLFGVEILSFIANGLLLWYFCKINLLVTLKKLQKEFWFVFAIAEAFLMMEVLSKFLINVS